MTTQETANRLYELCKQGQSKAAMDELYSPEATSTEKNMQGELEKLSGTAALTEKKQKFSSMVEETHSAFTNEPKVFGDYIFMEMGMDVTMKHMGRMDIKEMCEYEVKDGKIISERFFY